jgi:hypothetical protein
MYTNFINYVDIFIPRSQAMGQTEHVAFGVSPDASAIKKTYTEYIDLATIESGEYMPCP